MARAFTYGSVCSGIEAATAAWHPLGWTPAFFSEIEAAPQAVLAHHHPTVPIHGDFTTIEAGQYEPIDLLVGGTPCQDFSVAGLRAGLAGERGNLTLEFVRLADRLRPLWIVWENVPGVLSIDGGRAFGAFLGGLAQLGYGFAYRVLDAQHFGVPQRRRRVFVVGYLGDWRRAAAVLFERESLSGNPPPRREAGTRAPAGALAGTSPGGGWRFGADEAAAGQLVEAFNNTGQGWWDNADAAASVRKGNDAGGGGARESTLVAQAFGGNDTRGPIDVATAVNAHGGPHGRQDFESETFVTHSLRADGFDASEDGTGRGTPLVPVAFDTTQITSAENRCNPKPGDPCHPLASGAHPPAIAFSSKDHGADAGETSPTLRAMGHAGSHANAGGQVAVAFGISSDAIDRSGEGDGSAGERAGLGIVENAAPSIRARATNSVATASAVRRLTPMECERLQGFPDGYTLVQHRGKPMADGPRYKMLGNSMAVPCMAWIGQRIELVTALAAEGLAA